MPLRLGESMPTMRPCPRHVAPLSLWTLAERIRLFHQLNRFEQIRTIRELARTNRVSITRVCDIVYEETGVYVSPSECRKFGHYIPTTGLSQRPPAQITRKIDHVSVQFAVTETQLTRMLGKNARDGQF
jgi:hypothetical protein